MSEMPDVWWLVLSYLIVNFLGEETLSSLFHLKIYF